jgi:hypothetical protein
MTLTNKAYPSGKVVNDDNARGSGLLELIQRSADFDHFFLKKISQKTRCFNRRNFPVLFLMASCSLIF